eukprot:m.306304 g.306304  ORF g.306304 m.306304 type:complete len:794 (+) comp41138_c0_seq1:120-2501(+)
MSWLLCPALIGFYAAISVSMLSYSVDGQYAPWSNATCTPKPRRSVVRKELSTLTDTEQLQLRLVFQKLMEKDKVTPGDNCTFFNVAKHHGYFSARCQHETTTCYQKHFLPWHRIYSYEIEQAGQTIFPDFALPYWDFTKTYASSPNDSVQSLLPELFSNATFFNPNTNTTEPNPLYIGYHVPAVNGLPYKPDPNNEIKRSDGNDNGILNCVRQLVCLVFDNYDTFDDFSRFIECPHNQIHNFVGGDFIYSMSAQRWTSFDPIFFVFHSMIDRLWAIWEKQNPTGDDTSTAMNDATTFIPFGDDWTFADTKDYVAKMGYTYDNLPDTFDFCNAKPPVGSYALYGHFTTLPISYQDSYSVRLIADVDGITGEGQVGLLNNSDIIGQVAIPHAMGRYSAASGQFERDQCTSPSCSTWCPSCKSVMIPPDEVEKYNKTFNLLTANKLFVEVREAGTPPISLSGNVSVANFKQALGNRNVLNLAAFSGRAPPVQITAGTVLAEPLKCARNAATKVINVHWTYQTPNVAYYPDCIAQPGDRLVFDYFAPEHSVALVFENEFAECTAAIIPQCPDDKNPPSGSATCNYTIPADAPDATYYFICTQEDHCAVRGMRMRVVVGNGGSYNCPSVVNGAITPATCDSSKLNIDGGTKAVSRPANEALTGGPSYKYGTRVRFSCNEGYKMTGFPELLCLQSGQWSSSTPTCNSSQTCKGCDASVLNIQNGKASTPSSSGNAMPQSYCYPTEVTFTCNEGFPMVGSKTTKCQETGVWSPEIPTCRGLRTVPLFLLLALTAAFAFCY